MSGDDKSLKLVDQEWKSVSLCLILQPHSDKLQDGCIVAWKPRRDASCTLSLVPFDHRFIEPLLWHKIMRSLLQKWCLFASEAPFVFFFKTHIRANWPNSIPKSKQKSTKNWKAKLKERRKMSFAVKVWKALSCWRQAGPCLIAKSGQGALLFVPSHSSDCKLQLL